MHNTNTDMKTLTIRKITDQRARREISQFFMQKLSRGVKKIDVSIVSASLRIPGGQVEKIFYEFINEGRVRRI